MKKATQTAVKLVNTIVSTTASASSFTAKLYVIYENNSSKENNLVMGSLDDRYQFTFVNKN